MWRRSLLLALLALFLCACTAPETHPDPSDPLLALPPVEQPARQTLVFLVDSGAAPVVVEAAELFQQKVSEFTGGMLTVELRRTITPVEDYLAGKGQIVFLDSRKNQGASPDFPLLSDPLRYADYKVFTMSLNSRRMLEAVNDSLMDDSTRLIAAYYQSGEYLISAQPLYKGEIAPRANDEPLAEDEERWAATAVLCPDTTLTDLMEELGAKAQRVQSANDRLYQLAGGRADIAEFTVDEIFQLDWQDSAFNVINVNYAMTPLWLVVHSGNYEALPVPYQAVLQEAATYLFPAIDDRYREREAAAIEHLRQQGLTVDRSFSALRSTARARDNALADDLRAGYLLGLIQDING